MYAFLAMYFKLLLAAEHVVHLDTKTFVFLS